MASTAPGAEPFAIDAFWLAAYRFTVVLIASAVVALAMLWLAIGPVDPTSHLVVLGLVAAAALVAGGALWTALGWARRRIVVGDDRIEEHSAWAQRTIRFEDVERVAIRVLPGMSGAATIVSHDARIEVATSLAGADRLIRRLRAGLVAAGRESVVDDEAFAAFLEAAVCSEHRVQRFSTDYPWLPWFAVVCPLAVVLLGYATRLPPGSRLVWAAVFAAYPWIVVAVAEWAILARFFRAADAIAPTAPGRDRGYEREMRLRALLVGYFVYLGANLAMLWRHA